MTLLGLLKASFDHLQRTAKNRLAYRQLQKLPPYLLDDIGVKLEKGRIITLHSAPSDQAAKALQQSPVQLVKTSPEKRLRLCSEENGG